MTGAALKAGRLTSIAVVALALFACVGVVDAQPRRIVDWTETVELEHQDRLNRLRRLAGLRGIAAPQFQTVREPRVETRSSVEIPILRTIFAERVFFDTDRSEIKSSAEAVLDIVAENLRREPPDVALFVSGHTDSRGSDTYNFDLSLRRADAVARALLRRNVGISTIWRVGFGKSAPIADNDTAEHMSLNRRVEFLFARKPEPIANWLSQQPAARCVSETTGSSEKCRARFEALAVNRSSVDLALPQTPATVALPNASTAPTPGRTTTDVLVRSAPTDTSTTTATVTPKASNKIIIDLEAKRSYVGDPEL